MDQTRLDNWLKTIFLKCKDSSRKTHRGKTMPATFFDHFFFRDDFVTCAKHFCQLAPRRDPTPPVQLRSVEQVRMARGNQRELARNKNLKKNQEKAKGRNDDGLTPQQRRERWVVCNLEAMGFSLLSILLWQRWSSIARKSREKGGTERSREKEVTKPSVPLCSSIAWNRMQLQSI